MTPFLQRIAQSFYDIYGDRMSQLAFVFPNRRSGLFFQKYLGQIAQKPIFSPQVITINDLMAELSPYSPIDRISLLAMVYKRYVQLRGSDETFDNFLFWGEMLLGDFDDVDKYMVDARQLFTNIHDLKEIDDFEYLTEEQMEIIKRFWGHLFYPSTESNNKQQFIQLWEILFDLYTLLREDLATEGRAYEGMIFREVAERCRRKEELNLPYKQVIFVGFNAITEAERVFMKYLRDLDIGDFYWDYYAPTLQEDKYNRATFFLNDNKSQFPSKIEIDDSIDEIPQIELYSIPSGIGQTKQTTAILQSIFGNGEVLPDDALNTAVVLPDEELLQPMLYSIPANINPINITMGYTLQRTTVAALMDSLFHMQRHIRYSKGEPRFYHLDVKQLLGHRFIATRLGEEAHRIVTYIGDKNRVFLSQEELGNHPLVKQLFKISLTADDAAAWLIDLLETLQQGESAPKEENETKIEFSAVEREFMYHYYITVKRLRDVIQAQQLTMMVDTFFRLLSKMAASISIPFRGEPLSGLQIMGVLETRALDFDNLIILSMNEGVFPVKKIAPSFIPYNLRRGFGMATTEHQDSIYAYYFYRMISRAKRVFLLYDSRTEGLKSGEVSRYIYQLKYHYRYPIKEIEVNCDISTFSPSHISIDKHSQGIREKLGSFLEGGENHLSASAINRYLNCPLQFYLQYVEGIKRPNDVAESVDSSSFGTIYHGIMQDIYDRIQGNKKKPVVVTRDILNGIIKNEKLLNQLLEKRFAKEYYKDENNTKPLKGYDLLTGKIILKLVLRTLEKDKERTPFTYIESECKVFGKVPLTNNRAVQLKGYIDRIDQSVDGIRIVDYKTGSDKLNFSSVDELFDKKKKERRKAILQLLLYCKLYKEERGIALPLQPVIYLIRNLFNKFEPFVKYNKDILYDYSLVEDEFNRCLTECLEEIFNLDIPFTQTPEEEHCEYCDFKALCRRG